jgi:hypothetical protein
LEQLKSTHQVPEAQEMLDRVLEILESSHYNVREDPIKQIMSEYADLQKPQRMDSISRYLKIVAEKFFATERYIQVLDLLDVEKFLMQDSSKRRLETYREASDYIDEQLHARLYGTDDRRTTINNLINSIVVNRKQLKDLELDKKKNDDTIK